MNKVLEIAVGWILLASTSIVLAQEVPPPGPTPTTQVSPSVPAEPARPSLDFHAALAPYGTWRTLEPHGEVWVPRDMPPGWRPYTTGHWVFTDAVGWTWVDDAPWGWAPFHYGRWTLDASLGWVWIPGNVWAPAWVAWRENDDFVGWAPLPPCVTWRAGIGLAFGGADLSLAIWDPWWCFVPVGHLCHPHVCEVLLVPERVQVVVRGTRLVERGLVLENGRRVNRAISVDRVEKARGQPVTHVVLRDVDRPEALPAAGERPDEVVVFRPRARPIASAPRAPAPLPQQPRAPVRVIPQTRPQPEIIEPARPHPHRVQHHERNDDNRGRGS